MPYHTFLFLFLSLTSLIWAEDPKVLYLTWKGDPTSTMTVMWHTDKDDSSRVYYKALGEEEWKQTNGETRGLKQYPLYIHQIELTGLKADTTYLFHLENGQTHTFRTMPTTLDRPLKVVVGGDAYFTSGINEKMNLQVASRDPDFVILAGDIAYTEGLKTALRPRSWRIERWETFFKEWTKAMITKEGRLIPIVPTLGNHDVREGFDHPLRQQVLFYEFFAFPYKGIPYQLLKVGKACFYLLDSGHSYSVGEGQTEWLEKSLSENTDASFHFPVYHIAAYPTDTAFTHRGAKDIRKYWIPLFEKYGVKVALEHDNHTFKRTFPIKEEKIAPEGIIYVGDGAWGVPPVKPTRHWYLAKALQTNCYWLLTISSEKCQFQALNLEGEELDRFEIGSSHSNF